MGKKLELDDRSTERIAERSASRGGGERDCVATQGRPSLGLAQPAETPDDRQGDPALAPSLVRDVFRDRLAETER
jgi:hypothetical protein